MPFYRLFQINQADRIADEHVVMCFSDEEATAAALRFLDGYAAVEVWHRRRRINRIMSPPATTAGKPVR